MLLKSVSICMSISCLWLVKERDSYYAFQCSFFFAKRLYSYLPNGLMSHCGVSHCLMFSIQDILLLLILFLWDLLFVKFWIVLSNVCLIVFFYLSLQLEVSMAGPGSSMLYSFLLFIVILSLQEVYRGKLASSELFTIFGGFTSSLIFLVLLTVSSDSFALMF